MYFILHIYLSKTNNSRIDEQLFGNDAIYSLPELFFLYGFFVVFLYGLFNPKVRD